MLKAPEGTGISRVWHKSLEVSISQSGVAWPCDVSLQRMFAVKVQSPGLSLWVCWYTILEVQIF